MIDETERDVRNRLVSRVVDWIALALLTVEALCFLANLVISFRLAH